MILEILKTAKMATFISFLKRRLFFATIIAGVIIASLYLRVGSPRSFTVSANELSVPQGFFSFR